MNAAITSGILNVHKPAGMSSRQAVDLVKQLVQPAKIGHAGTLDPLASGVLVMCIGKATRLIEFVQRMPKRYCATFLLGRTSPTEDIEGEVVELADPHVPAREEIERACERLLGAIAQRPPAFSALKVAGRRSYDLARRGEAVELAPRTVMVYALSLVEYDYPRLKLDVQCGAGTYVRSLGRDLAESLGSGAVMSELVRTAIGHFEIDNAIDPRRLTASELSDSLQPPQAALVGLPIAQLDEQEIALVAHGRLLDRPDVSAAANSEGLLVAVHENGSLVAVMRHRDGGALTPHINFVGKG
jgi:tRNA pseudouridine55 synthase